MTYTTIIHQLKTDFENRTGKKPGAVLVGLQQFNAMEKEVRAQLQYGAEGDLILQFDGMALLIDRNRDIIEVKE